jgi:hypothetical protein
MWLQTLEPSGIQAMRPPYCYATTLLLLLPSPRWLLLLLLLFAFSSLHCLLLHSV